MSRLEELQAQIDALGRPKFGLPVSDAPNAVRSRMSQVSANVAAWKAWDTANPEKALRRLSLLAKYEAEELMINEQRREKRAAERLLEKLGASGVGQRSLDAAKNPKETPALTTVREWLPRKHLVWLVLCGDPGTGKNVASTWAVLQTMRAGGTAAFRLVGDFGTELATDYARSRLFSLLEFRHENYCRTILTSNFGWLDSKKGPGLQKRLGERLADRIRQAGDVHELGPESFRRTAQAEMPLAGEAA